MVFSDSLDRNDIFRCMCNLHPVAVLEDGSHVSPIIDIHEAPVSTNMPTICFVSNMITQINAQAREAEGKDAYTQVAPSSSIISPGMTSHENGHIVSIFIIAIRTSDSRNVCPCRISML